MSEVRKRPATYQELFNKVHEKRLKFTNNIAALLTVISCTGLALPYEKLWYNILSAFVKAPLVFSCLFLIKHIRSKNITVSYTHHRSLGSHIYYTLISSKFWFSFIGYWLCSFVFAGIYSISIGLFTNYYIISKEYNVKPKLNDEWMYLWYYATTGAFFYTLQQFVFERNRLKVKYGVSKVEPKAALFKKIPELVIDATVINTILTVLSPLIYYFFRSIFYKLGFVSLFIMGLDTRVPHYGLSASRWFSFSYLSFNMVLTWELFNHAFEVYATIGCLDGKKPISTYSADPINTLLSGLRNSDPASELSRLTAFQELAYISTLNTEEGAKLRTAIYNAHLKNGFIWSAILDECSLVIKQTTQRINYRTNSDAKILQKNRLQIKDEIKNDHELFGNSFIGSPDTTNSLAVKSYKDLIDKQKPEPPKTNLQKHWEFLDKSLFTPLSKLLLSLAGDKKAGENAMVSKARPMIKQAVSIAETYRRNFLATSLGVPFRVTLKRDTESRVLNPVNFGNAVIAVSNLLIHAVEEDRSSSITPQHISDTLNLIEKPIRACATYVDKLPPLVFLTLEQQKKDAVHAKHLINLIHDLTLFNFKQLCISYHSKLGDLMLSATCFKLAKRVIDEEIAKRG